jgi:hypothetical protein
MDAAPANRLLGALPIAEYKRLVPLLTRALITYAHFPVSGCVSMVSTMEEGAVEVATVGSEGLVGLPLLHHTESTLYVAASP